MRRLLLTTLLVLVPASPAGAAVFPGEIIDGPTGDLVSFGRVDVSRDGTGGVVYVKRDGGADHIFVSRLVDGAFGAPERVDAGVSDPGAQPTLAAGENGRLLVAWVAGGSTIAVVRPDAASPFTGPQVLGGGRLPDADVSPNGHGYVIWSGGGDVRAARLERTSSTVAPIAAPLDVDAARDAGSTVNTRPRVAVSADGVAVASWAEAGRVYARRLFGATISSSPQDATLAGFDNAAGGEADQPSIDVEDDSSYAWVVFRQTFNGRQRAIGRRLRGGAFEAPEEIDAGTSEGVDSPAVALNGRGVGLGAVGLTGSGAVLGSVLDKDTFAPAQRIDTLGSRIAPRPQVTSAQNDDGYVAWITGSAAEPGAEPTGPLGILPPPGGNPAATGSPDAQLRARPYDDGRPTVEVPLSRPEFGPVDALSGFGLAGNRVNDATVVAIQGTGSGRRLVATMIDRPPGGFVATTTQGFRRFALPPLAWASVRDLWGGATYTVFVDGRVVGQTRETKLTPKTPIADGEHRFRVVATDRRGQTTSTPLRLLRVDTGAPTVSFRLAGTRRARSVVRVTASASDVRSGVRTVRIDFGDGSGPVDARSAPHVYASRGTYTVRVTATDRAGNATASERQVRIAAVPKPKKKAKKGD